MRKNYDDEIPKRREITLKKAPRPREFYWCRYPVDAEIPELWKERPVIILSSHSSLSGCVLVVPCTSTDQSNNSWAVSLDLSIDGKISWAVCDKPSSFAVSRLRPQSGSPRASEDNFTKILQRVSELFPKPILSKLKRTEIASLILKRHSSLIQSSEQAERIVDDVFNLIRSVKG